MKLKLVAISPIAHARLLKITDDAKTRGEPLRYMSTIIERMIEVEYEKRFG